jgi:Uma2 family endonuclease
MMKPHSTLITAEAFEQRYTNRPYELVAGRVVKVLLHGGLHGIVANLIGYELRRYLMSKTISDSVLANTGFYLSNDTVLAPDVAYLSAKSLTQIKNRAKFVPFAPDFVAEVVSPGKRTTRPTARVELYQNAGTAMVWMIDTEKLHVTNYRTGQEPQTIGLDGTLDGGDLLPGCRIRVADLFPENTKQD